VKTLSILRDCVLIPELKFIDNVDRRKNHAMVGYMDEVVGNLTDALKHRQMWEMTLLVWSRCDADRTSPFKI
jgi:hypothetical protein